ncbi:MAG: hypothetical protein ACRDHZ_11130, partial [Ktedonobacteraceae bacterium]
MEFYLTKKKPNPQKDRPLLTELGKSVCYEEPLHYTLFPNLMNVLQNTEWPYQFHGYYYWIRTKSDIFEEIIPASEYYKISYRAMSQKYHGALANYEEINRIIESLSDSYLRRRGQVGNSSQPKLVFTKELYTLRAEFSSLLFLIRAMLDQLAVLIQFLSGPRSR